MQYSPKDYVKPNKSIIYKKASGVNLALNVYYPENCREKTPVALCVHGGGWTAIDKENQPIDNWQGSWMKHQAVYYAKRGFVGIEITYRSIKLEGVEITDIVEDCEDAVRFVRKNIEYADVDNMFAIGDSAGGQLVLCLAFSKDEKVRPKAVVACNPVTDCVEKTWEYISCSEEIRRKYSPMFNVKKSEVSFLVVHGTADDIVPYETAVEYVEKMKKIGNDIELLSIDGGKHAFILYEYKSTDDEVLEYMHKIDKFIDKQFPNMKS
ncbi:MAG: prolyl oligopeptidase family serine peptidase [Clostridia bacterium]|nr:prolyl oligopeptidase family serine peptidase [Clostridia bacterium]